MSTTLLPEFTESTFDPLVKKLEEGRQGKELSAEEVRELLLVCNMAAKVVDWVSESTETFLNCGAEHRFLGGFVGRLAKITGYLLDSAYPEVRSIAAGEALPPAEKTAAIRKLDEHLQRANAVHRELAKLQAWLEQPPTASSFTETQLSSDPKQYRDIERILTELKGHTE